MKNVQMELKGSILTVTMDLSKRGDKSKSGKSLQVASTEGNISVPGMEGVKIGINAYVGATP